MQQKTICQCGKDILISSTLLLILNCLLNDILFQPTKRLKNVITYTLYSIKYHKNTFIF